MLEGGKKACVFSNDGALFLDNLDVEDFMDGLRGKNDVVLEAVRLERIRGARLGGGS